MKTIDRNLYSSWKKEGKFFDFYTNKAPFISPIALGG
jgi:hypothetical protein